MPCGPDIRNIVHNGFFLPFCEIHIQTLFFCCIFLPAALLVNFIIPNQCIPASVNKVSQAFFQQIIYQSVQAFLPLFSIFSNIFLSLHAISQPSNPCEWESYQPCLCPEVCSRHIFLFPEPAVI